jgi:hypothetical protein
VSANVHVTWTRDISERTLTHNCALPTTMLRKMAMALYDGEDVRWLIFAWIISAIV